MPGLTVKGVDLTPRRDTFESIETASRDEISALQLKCLQWTLAHVYKNVAHYKEVFDAAGMHPDDLKTLDDLRRFPFTTKAELREKYPFALMAMPREELLRVHASSGTTGKPTVVGYSRRDIETWAGLIARGMRAAGCRPGMLAQNSYGYGLLTGGLGFRHGAEKFGMTVVPASGGMTERQVKLIEDFKPDVIFVTPSYLLAILDEFRTQALDPRKSSLKIAMCGAEPWTTAMRAEIEEAFDMHAVDTYGLSEVIGPGVSSECIETKDGCTIWEDHFYPEVIDPQTGKVLPDGEVGEQVFTSLTKEAMPVIRYRTRDLSRLLPGTARSMRRMERVISRSDDMMIIRGVNVFPSQIEAIILKDERVSPYFAIELRRAERLDSMTVLVEARPGTPEADWAKSGRDLAHHIKSMIGVSAEVKTVKPGSVERSAGKAKRVIDLRKKG